MSDLHALLIGIDCYLPNEFPGGGKFESLSGSVRDVERVEQFLLQELRLPPEKIRKLTSSRGSVEPVEPEDRLPTYENMVTALQELARTASAGDQIYIHYSGHGGRTVTIFPEVKGEEGYDESLVPCDIGDSSARYLRGAEVSFLVRDMVSKGLLVTLVFDCCHAGGASRGAKGAVKRGLGIVDRRQRPTASLVATREELLELMRPKPVAGPVRRNLSLQSWLPDPQGYVLLAACRPQEFALEYPFDGKETQGALTYWLLDSLRQGGTSLTYKQLHERIFAKVHNQFLSQSPMLIGESSRPFFGNAQEPGLSPLRADTGFLEPAVVMAVEGSRVLLHVGQAEGARIGLRYAIYRPFVDPAQGSHQAIVEIRDLGATESWAEIIETTRSMIEQGAQAVPLGLGRDAGRLQGVVDVATGAALDQARSAIAADPTHYIRVAKEGDRIDFRVTVNDLGDYALLDAGSKPISNLRPALSTTRPDSISELVRRLIHLTKYRNVQRIENADDQNPLKKVLGLKVLGTQMDFEPGDTPDPQIPAKLDPLDLRIGEWLFLEISNQSQRILNFAVLDLQPDWGISRIFPGQNDSAFWPLDPGESKVVRIKGFLPPGYNEATDIIKVFATMGTPNFRWLLLPPLDQPEIVRRNMAVSAFASEEWMTQQLEVRLRK